MFTPLGSLIKTLPKRSKTPEAILALHIRQAFGASLKSICADLPSELLDNVKASVFKSGTLYVICPPLLAAELSMRSGGLIKDINKSLGRRVVFGLRFKNS